MATFGYPTQYANGLNNNTQLRRSTDMIYQRGGTYEIDLTGSTYETSIQMVVDLYANDSKVGTMALVPFDVTSSGPLTGLTFTYKFNLRPYNYIQNYVETEHYQYYHKNDWFTTNNIININNPYPNNVKANYKFGWRYINASGITETEFTGGTPTNNFNHYTDIPYNQSQTGFTASGFTNTGPYFDYVGGAFQMDTDHYILPNFDQEIGTVMGTGLTINTLNIYRRLSPMSQFLMDSPTVPEPSQTSRFLTDAPRIQYIQSDENYVLYYLAGQTGDRQVIPADYLVLQFYNSSNTRINYVQQQLNFSGTTYASPTGYTDNLRVFNLPVGPQDIVNLYSSIDWSNISYYTAQIFYGLPTNDPDRVATGPIGPLSESFSFYLTENCLPENTRLAFLNTKGGFDYYTFTAYRQDSKKIKTESFDNRYYATNLSSPDRNYGRSVKTFDTNVTQEIVLDTDYLSVEQGNWLEELFYSPQVYIMNKDYISPMDRQDKYYKDLLPIQVISTEVDTITKKHKKLNKYRITVRTANSFFVNKGF
jgi:hypothetical protein